MYDSLLHPGITVVSQTKHYQTKPTEIQDNDLLHFTNTPDLTHSTDRSPVLDTAKVPLPHWVCDRSQRIVFLSLIFVLGVV